MSALHPLIKSTCPIYLFILMLAKVSVIIMTFETRFLEMVVLLTSSYSLQLIFKASPVPSCINLWAVTFENLAVLLH